MNGPPNGPNYYVVVATDTDRARLTFPSGLSVAKTCLSGKAWGIGERTQNRTSLRRGDKLIVYIAGVRESPRSFVAEAAVAGPVQAQPLSIPPKAWPFSLPLSHCRWLPHPVPIHSLLDRLGFIANSHSKKWGSCLQGGIVKISKVDFDTIKRAATKPSVGVNPVKMR